MVKSTSKDNGGDKDNGEVALFIVFGFALPGRFAIAVMI
jgi:hypothetical protein